MDNVSERQNSRQQSPSGEPPKYCPILRRPAKARMINEENQIDGFSSRVAAARGASFVRQMFLRLAPRPPEGRMDAARRKMPPNCTH